MQVQLARLYQARTALRREGVTATIAGVDPDGVQQARAPSKF